MPIDYRTQETLKKTPFLFFDLFSIILIKTRLSNFKYQTYHQQITDIIIVIILKPESTKRGIDMSAKYSMLADMGIVNPEQIDRYSLQSSGDVDVLRVIYKREKGSLLPSSKKFKFPRNVRYIEQDAGNKKSETISEVSPGLSKAIVELHSIVNQKHTRAEQKEIIEDEILRLEEEISTRVTYLKSLVKNLDD